MSEAKFEALFQEELELLYDTEKQMVAALPKMIAAASSEQLTETLQDHLGETEDQVIRLERIFEAMGEEPGIRSSEAVMGLIQEGESRIAKLEKSAVLDASIIGTARKIEQYEICGYETVRALAELLGQPEAVDLLEQTIDEESAASDALADQADAIFSGENLSEGDRSELLEEEEIFRERAEGGA
jgi:ferritin-like metal-binding protein YciE